MLGMVIADDEQLIRQGLMTIDWLDYGIEIKSVCTNGLDALELIQQTRPEIVLTDIRMPGMDGIELSKLMMEQLPDARIILLTAHHEFEYAHAAIRYGVSGFVLKPTTSEEVIEAVLKAKREYEDKRERDQAENRLRRQIKQIQKTVQDGIAAQEGERPVKELVAQIIEFVETRYMEDIQISSAAEHVHLSPVYLSRLLKKETGETYVELLTRIRIRKAYELLQNVDIKIYEIAERVGFTDPRYFGQVFRRTYGMTPRQLRKKLFRNGGENQE